MTKVTFLPPTSKNISSYIIPASLKKKFTFSRNSNPIIYSNYPEQIGVNGTGLALAENGYFINQQDITTGEAQIFFSHENCTGGTLKYGIRVYNPNSSPVTVSIPNCGYDAGWFHPENTVKTFFTNNKSPVYVNAKSHAWLIYDLDATSSGILPFSGMIRISTTGNIRVTMYAYLNRSSVKDTEKVYPYNDEFSANLQVYSGVGSGYFLSANHGNQELSSPYVFHTNGNNLNYNEITPLKLVGTNKTASENAATPLNNLANWCTQNYHTITFTNNTNAPKTIYGYIGNNHTGNTPVMQFGGNVDGVLLETINGQSNNHSWKWCKIEMEPTDKIYTFSYQEILASYGNGGLLNEWSTIERF